MKTSGGDLLVLLVGVFVGDPDPVGEAGAGEHVGDELVAVESAPALLGGLEQLERHPERGGYRDPESQAFIESWFSKLKERCIWREEFETLDAAREEISHYIDHYHHRPHSRLNYKTPREVAAIWQDPDDHLTPAA